ncbi:MAG TPA: hypothetical protein VF535_13415, partial [Allosphingosinicella sp.]
DCNSEAAARSTGFHPSTVVQALRRDRAFALANRAALERGYVRLDRQLALENARRAERMKRFLDRGLETRAEPTSDPDHLLRLLDRYRRPDRPVRPGAPRRPALTLGQSIAALERKLENLDLDGWSWAGGDARAFSSWLDQPAARKTRQKILERFDLGRTCSSGPSP